MALTNEQRIINQILSGDTQMFTVLVDEYKSLVFTLALRMLKHREDAEEVSQDTFVKVYKSLHKFKGESKLSTWIYKVTYNTCLDRLKRNKHKFNEVTIDAFTEKDVKTIHNAFDALVANEREEAVKKCIDQLPHDDSFLLTLFYFEDQSLEDISNIIGVKTNNVKVKLHRSRKKLAVILKQHLEPDLIATYEHSKR